MQEGVAATLVEFVDELSRVKTMSELNVLAGITYEDLTKTSRPSPARSFVRRLPLAAALLVSVMALQPGLYLDRWGDHVLDAFAPARTTHHLATR